MHMRMMRERRAPHVQDQRGTDLRAQMLGIGGDGAQDLGRNVKQQAINHGLVGVGDRADWLRQREDHMVILDRQ
jgi:hypothetical protein